MLWCFLSLQVGLGCTLISFVCVCVCVYIYIYILCIIVKGFDNTLKCILFIECLGHLPCLKASNKERNQRATFEEEKLDLSTNQYFRHISPLKNPIDSKLDRLELWLKYLQFLCFEFFEIHKFWRPKLTHKLLL